MIGSLDHDTTIVPFDETFILAGYTIPCSGTVVAWEFCYRISHHPMVSFYPGIWRITGTTAGNMDYLLIQLNNVTYNPNGTPLDLYPCMIYNLSSAEQFTVPAESVVGLYSNVVAQLLHTNTDNSLTTYRFRGNHSRITDANNNNDADYNIAIKVHLGKYSKFMVKILFIRRPSNVCIGNS